MGEMVGSRARNDTDTSCPGSARAMASWSVHRLSDITLSAEDAEKHPAPMMPSAPHSRKTSLWGRTLMSETCLETRKDRERGSIVAVDHLIVLVQQVFRPDIELRVVV